MTYDKQYQDAYRQTESGKAAIKKYKDKNRDKINAYQREYRAKNRDKINAARRASYNTEEGKLEAKIKSKIYREKNAEKIRTRRAELMWERMQADQQDSQS